MKKYLIKFNDEEIISVEPVADNAHILTPEDSVHTTLTKAKRIFTAIGINTQKLNAYKEEETINDEL